MSNKTMKTLTIGGNTYELVDETARSNIKILDEKINKIDTHTIIIDTTLTQSGQAAEALAVGTALGNKASNEDIENVAGDIENINNILIATNNEVERIADQIVTKDNIENAVEESDSFKNIQNQINEASNEVNTIQTEIIPDLEARVQKIESGVHITNEQINLHIEGSPFSNVANSESWVVTENGKPLLTGADGKMTSPKMNVTDALMIGGLAWKAGTDKHVRLLKYGR